MGRDHGDGGIDERGKDRWRLRYRVGGKRYTKTVRGNITDAKRELRRLLKSGDDGAHVAPDKMTVALWTEQWLALRAGKIAARTSERYAELFRLHVLPTIGSIRLQTVTPTIIDGLYQTLKGKGLGPGTIRHVHNALNACFRSAEQKDLILRNPIARAEAPSENSTFTGTALDQDQLASLVNGFRKSVLFPLVATAAYTGMRRGELLALRLSDLDAEAKTLHVGRAVEKTKAHGLRFKGPKSERGRRTIVIDDGLLALLVSERERHERLAAALGIALPPDALMFPAPPVSGANVDLTRPRVPQAVTKEFVRKARALGFTRVRFHDLRVSHETMLLDAGTPIHVVAARGGHDPAMLLRTYAKRTRKADNSAAAMIGAMSKTVLPHGPKAFGSNLGPKRQIKADDPS